MSSSVAASTSARKKETLGKKSPDMHGRAALERFIVTIRWAENSIGTQTLIWNAAQPLALGHPIRWILERTDHGFRARDIAFSLNSVREKTFVEFSDKEALSEKPLRLPTAAGTDAIRAAGATAGEAFLRIKAIRSMPAAFEAAEENDAQTGKLRVFLCAGETITAADTVTKNHTAHVAGVSIFELKPGKEEVSIRALCDGIKIHSTDPLPKGETRQFSRTELAKTSISWGVMNWRFAFVQSSGKIALPQAPTFEAESVDGGDAQFKKTSKIIAGVFSALFLVTLIWPASKPVPLEEQELVPPQFAQIVMSKTPKPESASASAESKAPVKSAQDAQVVQAFRAKALQNSVKGLLKGGMTKLLAQSDFVNSASHASGIEKVFKQADGSPADGAVKEGIKGRKVDVAALGGSGTNGVGYGKGQDAKVAGQGTSFIDLDTGASNVATGLTKDEVGKVIHAHLSEIRYCYESAMVRAPDVEGRLVVDFTIGGNGLVKSSAVKTSTLPDPRLDDCVLRRLVKWKFPLPKGGVDVAVTYPFIFKSLGQ